jgi:hypothetical protein
VSFYPSVLLVVRDSDKGVTFLDSLAFYTRQAGKTRLKDSGVKHWMSCLLLMLGV